MTVNNTILEESGKLEIYSNMKKITPASKTIEKPLRNINNSLQEKHVKNDTTSTFKENFTINDVFCDAENNTLVF